ncbi:hypothetical protein, partial [Pectobacterium brasiliense]|uniref:hypothetical protein n=1 Tax=Pectobacterium brasiliense TaxID=180957 RepID=UPI001968FDAE
RKRDLSYRLAMLGGALMSISSDNKVKKKNRQSDGPDRTFELFQVYLDEIYRVAKLYSLATNPQKN